MPLNEADASFWPEFEPSLLVEALTIDTAPLHCLSYSTALPVPGKKSFSFQINVSEVRRPDQADDRKRLSAVAGNCRPEVRILLRLLHQQGATVGPEGSGGDGLQRGHLGHQRNRVRFSGSRASPLPRVRSFSADQELGEHSTDMTKLGTIVSWGQFHESKLSVNSP